MTRALVLTFLFSAAAYAQTTAVPPPGAASHAPAAPHALTSELQKARLPIAFKEGKLSGPGADLLLQELATTQFFLFGEEHATADIARLATALLEPAWKHGFRHVAIEIGPHTAAGISSYETVEAQLKRYPASIPFLAWKEETEFYAAAMKLGGGRRDTIWGVDQEFLLSTTPHLERLVAMAKDDASRAAATTVFERSRAADLEMTKTKNPGALFILSATAREDLATLRATFKDAEALRLIDALEESRAIYELAASHGWQSNQRRAELMKRLFADAYATAVAKGEAKPKVFVKLGGSHTMRGRSMGGVFDLGNMLPELATANGTRSFQIMVMPLSGFVNEHRPFSTSDDDKRAPYDPMKGLPFDGKPLYDAASPTEWSLFDLRPLKPLLGRGKLEPLEPRFRNVLWGYDAILIIPNVSPATAFD